MSNNNLSFKQAAVQILESVNEPLTAKEITEHAMQKGLLSTEGATPEATMAAQLYVDIRRNNKTKFKKIGKGKFSLIKQTESVTTPLLLIEKQNTLVNAALMKKLYEIDPFQFEYLIADLLKEIGYENVEVTRRSGDKGIDINGNLTMDGITNVKTVIQVKRFKKGNNISGSIITQLRGSAEVDQRGLVITTSDFTKDAVSEAIAPNKMPVSLVNGEKLLALLIKYEIGIKKENIPVYSLNNEYFENEEYIEERAKSSDKNKAVWPLPGGNNAYIETLNRYLEEVSQGGNSREKLVKWYMATFDNVNSEKSANGYINVPRSFALTSLKNGLICLTDDGQEFLKSKDISFLYNTIASNVLAFDEIVEFLHSSGEPQSEQSVLEFVNENFEVDWKTSAQVNYRLLWLMNLGKIAKTDKGYITVT
jgi:restriction endonuclease Mrr